MGAPPARSLGTVFDGIACEYDRSRPSYPDELVEHACEIAGIDRGDAVLEVGCGSGQLTRSLLRRGLRVTALEPGLSLIALAERNLEGAVDLVAARLEDAQLARGHFRAVFSASAFHWIDPDVSWRRAADALVGGGTLALVQYFGLSEQRSANDREAVLRAVARIAPEIAASWPAYRDLEATIAGVEARRANVAAAWAWLGSHDVARDYAAELFDDVRIAVLPMLLEHTADELVALLRTMSFWVRLSPSQRDALVSETGSLYEELGRPIRSGVAACLLTARRRPRPDT